MDEYLKAIFNHIGLCRHSVNLQFLKGYQEILRIIKFHPDCLKLY